MEVFTYDDYKALIRDVVTDMPKKGRGQWTQIAQHLGIHNVVLSQIFKGDKDLTPEQAFDLSDYLGFSDLEREFLILLVQKNRAGHYRLKNLFAEKIREARDKALDLKKRLKQDRELTDETRAIFYSNWYYIGAALACSIGESQTSDAIARRLDLPLPLVKKVVDFLVENGLCIKDGANIKLGAKQIHIGNDSPMMSRHHLNWRLKAIERMPKYDARKELFFTAPYSLSEELLTDIRGRIVKMVDECTRSVVDSDSQTMACLNIDWFQF